MQAVLVGRVNSEQPGDEVVGHAPRRRRAQHVVPGDVLGPVLREPAIASGDERGGVLGQPDPAARDTAHGEDPARTCDLRLHGGVAAGRTRRSRLRLARHARRDCAVEQQCRPVARARAAAVARYEEDRPRARSRWQPRRALEEGVHGRVDRERRSTECGHHLHAVRGRRLEQEHGDHPGREEEQDRHAVVRDVRALREPALGKLQPSKRATSECSVAMAAAAARLTAAIVPTMLEVRSTSSNAPSRSAIPAPRAIGNPSPRPRAAASSASHASRGVRPTRREPNAAAITTTLTARPDRAGRPARPPAARRAARLRGSAGSATSGSLCADSGRAGRLHRCRRQQTATAATSAMPAMPTLCDAADSGRRRRPSRRSTPTTASGAMQACRRRARASRRHMDRLALRARASARPPTTSTSARINQAEPPVSPPSTASTSARVTRGGEQHERNLGDQPQPGGDLASQSLVGLVRRQPCPDGSLCVIASSRDQHGREHDAVQAT